METGTLQQIELNHNSLVVLCGPAGSGKSTFAVKHFTPTQIVSSDTCRALISDDATNQRVSSHAFNVMHLILEKRLLLRRLTVADATNLEWTSRRWFIRTAQRFRFAPVAFVFDIPLEVCLERNRNRKRVVPEEAVIAQYELFEQTKRNINTEGFAAVHILSEALQSEVSIKVREISRRQERSPLPEPPDQEPLDPT